jgi:hypothetical protein
MNNRRKVVKALSIAGVVGVAWQTPVINSVILPAHAQTSDSSDVGWVPGDGTGALSSEEYLGDTETRGDCEELVKADRPLANGATFSSVDSGENECYAEFDMTEVQADSDYQTKFFQ